MVCSSSTRLKDGKCIKPSLEKCVSCAKGYFVSNDGRCIKIIIGCNEYDKLGRCSFCIEPFVKSKGSCVIPGCIEVNQLGCVRCASVFTLTNYGTCEIDNCKENDYQNFQCHQCE